VNELLTVGGGATTSSPSPPLPTTATDGQVALRSSSGPPTPPASLGFASLSPQELALQRYQELKGIVEDGYRLLVERHHAPAVCPSEPLSEPPSSSPLPVKQEANMRGMGTLRSYLAENLVAPLRAETRYLFTRGNPPQRLVYVESMPGSGVSLLLRSVCHSTAVNLIHIGMSSEAFMNSPKQVDGFFRDVVQYAIDLQPCVIFVDRCDAWFHGDGWLPRGYRFSLALQANQAIAQGVAGVWVLISAMHSVQETPPLQYWIRNRTIFVDALEEQDRAQVFASIMEEIFEPLLEAYKAAVRDSDAQDRRLAALELHQGNVPADNDQRSSNSSSNEELSENAAYEIEAFESIYKGAIECYRRMSLDWAVSPKHSAFTPGMIKDYCLHVASAARQGYIRDAKEAAAKGEKCNPAMSLPRMPHFAWVDQTIQSIHPGAIEWSA